MQPIARRTILLYHNIRIEAGHDFGSAWCWNRYTGAQRIGQQTLRFSRIFKIG